jgi:XTP/dITP diphosphohydrolase
MALVLGSRNPHKLRELAHLLAPHELLPLPNNVELPPETAPTFAANALEKARSSAAATGRPAVADDSGIEARALGGAPGVRSARFAGEGASDRANLDRLLAEVPRDGDRRVAYVCALAYAEAAPEGAGSGGSPVEQVFEGRCEGQLALSPRGEGGFGYDPAFLPADRDDGRTMAELSPEEKDAISHRGRAARELLRWLEQTGRAA